MQRVEGIAPTGLRHPDNPKTSQSSIIRSLPNTIRMKKIITTLILLLGFVVSYGQVTDSTNTVVADSTYQVYTDFTHIVYNMVSNSASEYYYPKLENKVKNNKSEMTVEECYYLYYGRLFKNKHKGVPFLASSERMDFDKAIARGNCNKIIKSGIPLLESNPVDLTVLLHTCKCMNDKKDERWEDYNSLLSKLLNAIFSEGTGQSLETAIKVIDIEDEHIIKGVLGFIGGTESLYIPKDSPGKVFNVWSKGDQKLYFEELFFEDLEGMELK